MTSRAEAVGALEARIGHRFKERMLIETALTHASAGDGAFRRAKSQLKDNERLEFLGDRVLGLVTAETLLRADSNAHEGDLAVRLNALVNGEACARAARRMDLGAALRLSGGETATGGRDKTSILADACEAVIAAVYLDAGLDAARGLIARFWAEDHEAGNAPPSKDPKTALQEWAQARGKPLPVYQVLGRAGPDHAPIFTVSAIVEGLAPESASGPSRQVAEKAAARVLLARERGAWTMRPPAPVSPP